MNNDKYISSVYDLYHKMILNISYTYLKNSELSQDVLQEVLIKLMKNKKQFDNESKEKYWIIRVTINVCKDYLKSAWYRKNTELNEEISYMQDDVQDVLSNVLKLPCKYKTVIYLYYYEGYSINEISKILNKKSATIGTWLSRAKKLLKERLKGDWDIE